MEVILRANLRLLESILEASASKLSPEAVHMMLNSDEGW
jgi:hypothetical protein